LKRWEMILAIAGLSLLVVGASLIRRSSLPRQHLVLVAGDCHTPATILQPPAEVDTIGTIILLHGLGANRRTMIYQGSDFSGHGFRVYLLDLAGHGDNRDPFTFTRARECADETVELLTRQGKIDPKKTILWGHSLGGAIAIGMADRDPMAATIAISPAPMVLPRRMPANLLVFVGQYDLWPMRRQAADLAAAAGGERTSAQDFFERRAFTVQVAPYATHTSLIVNRAVAQRSEQWAMETLFPNVESNTLALNLDLATYDRFDQGRRQLAGAVLGLLGLVLLFPLGAALVGAIAAPLPNESAILHPPYVLVIVEEAVCALASVLLLAAVVPLRFIHLYNGDYLGSLMLISGALLWLMNWKYAKQSLSFDVKPLVAAAAVGFVVILAMGGWFNWQIADLWMNGPRWLRFAMLLPGSWVFCFAEEAVLGPVDRGKHRTARFAVFLAMRLELWLACVFAYYMLANGQALIGVLVTGLAAFSMLQRTAADALRRRTGLATAAATFGAILAAWFVAAVFPLS
jgi:pimeloyl-ACP methyl ester carboxylesterase